MTAGEFLGIDAGNNGAYHRLATRSGQDADSEWRRETFTLSGNHIGDTFSVRFFGITTNEFTTIAIDNVMITSAAGSVIVEPVPEPEPPETPADLAVTALTARPTTVAPGKSILLRATAANTNTPTAAHQISFYRHDQATDNPKQGGVPLTNKSVTIGTNATRTVLTTTVAQITPGTYHYTACIQEITEEDTDNNCASTTVTVQGEEVTEPETPEPVEDPGETPTSSEPENGTPSFTISDVGATPHIVFEEDLITITATITNTGTATGEATISIYHTIEPIDVNLLGKRFKEPNTTTLTLTPEQLVTITSTHTAPTVTTRSLAKYYVCIDTSCSAPIHIGVQEKYPGPPYANCQHIPEQLNPMGGDRLDVKYGSTFRCGSTITLGGVEDVDEVRGFIASGHGVALENDSGYNDYSQTGMRTAHGSLAGQPTHFLGTVFKMPSFSMEKDTDRRVLSVDAAFIAYPKDSATDTYLEQLVPLKIRGAGDTTYTVIGSRKPTEGETLLLSGSRSGRPLTLIAKTDDVILGVKRDAQGTSYLYSPYAVAASGGDIPLKGDSGGPVYTTPDANGDVYIIGIVHSISGSNRAAILYSPWEEVENEFNLKPVGKVDDGVALFSDPISLFQTTNSILTDNDKTQAVVGRIDVPNDVIVDSVDVSVDIRH